MAAPQPPPSPSNPLPVAASRPPSTPLLDLRGNPSPSPLPSMLKSSRFFAAVQLEQAAPPPPYPPLLHRLEPGLLLIIGGIDTPHDRGCKSHSDTDRHALEKKEEHPEVMNAFEIISMSRGLNLGNLFDVEQDYKRETRFSSKCSAKEIISKIEETAKPLGFYIHKKNFKVKWYFTVWWMQSWVEYVTTCITHDHNNSRCGLCDTYYIAHVKDACAFLGDGMSGIEASS